MQYSFSAKYKISIFITFFFILAIFNFSCKKDVVGIPANPGIIAFNLLTDSTVKVDAKVSITNDSIKVIVPGTTVLANVVPQIKVQNNATISPASGKWQDFSKPVNYTVTAENGTKKSYVVVVTLDKLRSIAYIGTGNGALYTLDAITGDLIWSFTSKGNFSYSSPIFSNGVIYAGSLNDNMYAFDAAFGNLKWQFTTGSSIESSPTVADGIIYFGSDDYYFYALDATSGALKWKFKTGFNVSSSPAISNGIVYFASDDRNFYALDAKTGNLIWKYYTGFQFVAASPVIANNTVFIGDRSGIFYAFDAASGNIKWKFSTGNISLELSRPVIANGVIYLSSWYNIAYVNNYNQPGSVYAIDASTGALIWKSLDDIGFSSGAAVADGKLFIAADDGNIYARDATTGSNLWQDPILPNGAIPAVKDGTVFIGGGGTGYFYALDEISGDTKWKYPSLSINVSRPYIIGADGN